MNESTNDRLIEEAMRLFARHGYEGASIRRITQAAGANLGAVTYHFGTKRALYERTLERCIGPLAERVEAAAGVGGPSAEGASTVGDAPDPLARLDAALAVFFEYLVERPELPQLMLQEAVAGRRPPPGALKLVGRILGALGGAIVDAQAAGLARTGDPRLLAISVVSQPLHLTVASRAMLGLDTADAATRRVLLDHARAFVRRGLSDGSDDGSEGGDAVAEARGGEG